MNCEIIRGELVIAQNIPFNQEDVRKLIGKHGGNPAVVPSQIDEKIETGTITIYPVINAHNTDFLKVEDGYEREVGEDYVTYTYLYRDKTAMELADEYLSVLSDTHDKYEAGRVDYAGVFIKIDLEARINVTGLVDNFEAGLLTTEQWRGTTTAEGGTVSTLSIESVEDAKDLKLGITTAVAKGFGARATAEQEIATMVENEDMDALVSYDPIGRFTEIVNQ